MCIDRAVGMGDTSKATRRGPSYVAPEAILIYTSLREWEREQVRERFARYASERLKRAIREVCTAR